MRILVWVNLNLVEGNEAEKNLGKFFFFICFRDSNVSVIKWEKREIYLGIIIIYIYFN